MTSREPKKRWDSGWGYQRHPKMWKDIQNSDWNADWEHSIIRQFEDKQEALKYEAFMIAMLGTVRNGYNTSSYGGTSYKRTDETKKKLSESHIGKHHSEESKKKISEALSGEKNPNFGKHLLEEHKNKISEAMSGEKNPNFGKHHSEESKKKISESKGVNGIIQYSKDGKFIAEYPSIMEAERQTGCNNSHIGSCCKGERKSAGGFIWKYKEI